MNGVEGEGVIYAIADLLRGRLDDPQPIDAISRSRILQSTRGV